MAKGSLPSFFTLTLCYAAERATGCRAGIRLSRSILFCRIVVIGLTMALSACADFKKNFLCRPDGHCVNAHAGHTPTE